MFNLFRTLLDKVNTDYKSAPHAALPDGVTEQQLISVSLMLMVSSADFDHSKEETELARNYLQTEFLLSAEDAERVFSIAKQQVDNAISLHEFTSKLRHLSYEDRLDLLTALWQIAYVDDHLDPHEEAMIRKIADLLFIRHRDFIQCKLAVMPS